MKHIKTFPSTHRWCDSELQLHQRQPRLHCILDHSTTAIISCLWCGLHQHLWIFVVRNLMCEVFAYIVSIMMLMSCDMCSVAHIHGTLRSVRAHSFENSWSIIIVHLRWTVRAWGYSRRCASMLHACWCHAVT